MAAAGLILGSLTARSSHRRDPVIGGLPAQVFHWLSAVAFVAILPSVLTGLILGVIHFAIPIAIGMLFASMAAAGLYAVFELPARKARPVMVEDRGWTAEDALKSGL